MAVTKSDLDDFDLRLLEILQNDTRRPVPELAAEIGLSSPACYRRMRRLREIGAIEREVAVVEPRTLGWGLSMLVLVVLERERTGTMVDLFKKFSRHPQVVGCANVTGDYDLAIRMVAQDMEDYDRLTQTLLVADERVKTFKTLVVIREEGRGKGLPAAN